jgi:RimJ/RimL family protein N-acetyltransferase
MKALENPGLRADVRLTHLDPGCAGRMYRWMTDPDISSNLGLQVEPSLEKTQEWIAKAEREPGIRAFAILLNDVHVGNVVLDQIDTYLGKARFSIYIGEPSARSGGVGSTATLLALTTGFRELRLYKVWLTVHCCNDRAIKTYLRLGFQLEGVLRGEFLLGGRRLSAWYMSILSDEFLAMLESYGL